MNLELFDFSTLPLYYILAIVSGYVLASVLAENTTFWSKRETFEKLLIGGALGLCLLFGFVLPFALVYSFWVPMTMEQAIELSGYYVVVIFLFLPLSAIIVSKISRDVILKMVGYAILILPYAFMFLFFFSIVLNIAVDIYPQYLHSIIKQESNSFFGMTVVAFFFSSVNLIVYQLFITPLFSRTFRELPYRDMRWGKKPKTFEEKFHSFKWRLSLWTTKFKIKALSRNRTLFLIILLLILISPFIVIRIDNETNSFTAGLQISEEKLFSSPFSHPELVLNITQNSLSDTFSCNYYSIMYRNYTLYLPNLALSLKSVSIQNPSNHSRIGNFGNPNAYVNYLWDVNNLWLTCDVNEVNMSFSDSDNVETFLVNFTNVSDTVLCFNVTYFQEFASQNVSIDYNIISGEWYNKTKVDTYEFIITNNENYTLNVPQIEIGILSISDCDHENVNIYLNETNLLATVDSNAIKPLWLKISPFKQGNITITIPRQMT